jgi:hypothetical protein
LPFEPAKIQKQTTSTQKPETNNQQPATNTQKPASSNQSPATSIFNKTSAMKKIIIALVAISFFSLNSSAQSYEGSIELEKKKQAAIVINFSFPQEAVEGAMVEKLERMGLSAREEKGLFNSSKGFRTYKGAIIKDISENSMDYSFKVNRKGNDEAVVYLVMIREGSNVVTDRNEIVIEAAKDFLNDLLPEVEAFNLELQIKEQEEVVVKAEKKFKSLQDDQESMEKKIKKLQDDLKDNAKDQQAQQKEIEKQKQALQSMKSKRKG